MNPTIKSGPGYWMHETGGQLVPAMRRYLDGEKLSLADIRLVRAYLQQWIEAPVWDANPYEAGRARLATLRKWVKHLSTRSQIERWLKMAVEEGLDPL